MPCKTGTRENIENGKRRLVEERERNRSDPFRLHWRALVERVYRSKNGFEELTAAEQLYFAVSILEGEVFNGGFHQYFFNSSGALYETAVRGLEELGAWKALGLLRRAKAAVFPRKPVPVVTAERRKQLESASRPDVIARLDALDKQFWEEAELGSLLQAFAREHHLVS